MRQISSTELSTYQIRRALGTTYNRIFRWMQQGGLPFSTPIPKQRKINLEQFREWVKKNPEKLRGVNKDRLRLLIDDESVLEAIASLPDYSYHRPVIQLLPRLRRFKTMKEASEVCHVSYVGLASALRRAERSGASTATICDLEFLVEPSLRISHKSK